MTQLFAQVPVRFLPGQYQGYTVSHWWGPRVATAGAKGEGLPPAGGCNQAAARVAQAPASTGGLVTFEATAAVTSKCWLLIYTRASPSG